MSLAGLTKPEQWIPKIVAETVETNMQTIRRDPVRLCFRAKRTTDSRVSPDRASACEAPTNNQQVFFASKEDS